MEQLETWLNVIISGISAAFIAMSGVIVKLYVDNQKLHDRNAKSAAANVEAARKQTEFLGKIHEQMVENGRLAVSLSERMAVMEAKISAMEAKLSV